MYPVALGSSIDHALLKLHNSVSYIDPLYLLMILLSKICSCDQRKLISFIKCKRKVINDNLRMRMSTIHVIQRNIKNTHYSEQVDKNVGANNVKADE